MIQHIVQLRSELDTGQANILGKFNADGRGTVFYVMACLICKAAITAH